MDFYWLLNSVEASRSYQPHKAICCKIPTKRVEIVAKMTNFLVSVVKSQ
jgi:hypothetical protein